LASIRNTELKITFGETFDNVKFYIGSNIIVSFIFLFFYYQFEVGTAVGVGESSAEGSTVGKKVGNSVGKGVGNTFGKGVGNTVGKGVGNAVGHIGHLQIRDGTEVCE
jgi:hypothetical protein